jgi:hypothetical protein
MADGSRKQPFDPHHFLISSAFDLAVAERPGERQAVDFGANARRNRRDIDGFVAHGVTSRVRGIYEFSGTAATAAAITALSRRTVAISFRSMTRPTATHEAQCKIAGCRSLDDWNAVEAPASLRYGEAMVPTFIDRDA